MSSLGGRTSRPAWRGHSSPSMRNRDDLPLPLAPVEMVHGKSQQQQQQQQQQQKSHSVNKTPGTRHTQEQMPDARTRDHNVGAPGNLQTQVINQQATIRGHNGNIIQENVIAQLHLTTSTGPRNHFSRRVGACVRTSAGAALGL